MIRGFDVIVGGNWAGKMVTVKLCNYAVNRQKEMEMHRRTFICMIILPIITLRHAEYHELMKNSSPT
jgi:hypothetical protein